MKCSVKNANDQKLSFSWRTFLAQPLQAPLFPIPVRHFFLQETTNFVWASKVISEKIQLVNVSGVQKYSIFTHLRSLIYIRHDSRFVQICKLTTTTGIIQFRPWMKQNLSLVFLIKIF